MSLKKIIKAFLLTNPIEFILSLSNPVHCAVHCSRCHKIGYKINQEFILIIIFDKTDRNSSWETKILYF